MQTIKGEFFSEGFKLDLSIHERKKQANRKQAENSLHADDPEDPSGPEELHGCSLDLESEREAGILRTVNINQQNHSMLPGKQPPWIPIVDYFIKCFMALLYSSVNKSSACTSSNSLIPRTLHKVHLFSMGTVRAKSRANFFFLSLHLRMLCDIGLVTHMIDYPWTVKMIASLMKAHRAALECWCPWADH